MTEPTHQPPTELPPYRAVLSVDVKNFSGIAPADHHALTERIPLILERAFDRAGFGRIWEERRFPAGRGDGFVLGFRPETLPVLVGPFVDALQTELGYHHQMRLSSGDATRMRVSIAIGPLTDSDEARLGDGSGAAMIETHRLLDCEQVRQLLEDSDPDVTFVAAIISPRVYEDVVLSGYCSKAPGEFVPVEVAVKTYQGTAYLHVPKPSGQLLRRGIGISESPDGTEAQTRAAAATGTPGSGGVNNSMSGTVIGPAQQIRDHHGDAIHGGVDQYTKGDGNIVVRGNARRIHQRRDRTEEER